MDCGKEGALPFLAEGMGQRLQSVPFERMKREVQTMRSLSAAFTAGVACRAPST